MLGYNRRLFVMSKINSPKKKTPYSQVLLPRVSSQNRLLSSQFEQSKLSLSILSTQAKSKFTISNFHKEIKEKRDYYNVKQKIQKQRREKLCTIYFQKKVKQFVQDFLKQNGTKRIIDFDAKDLQEIQKRLHTLNQFIEKQNK